MVGNTTEIIQKLKKTDYHLNQPGVFLQSFFSRNFHSFFLRTLSFIEFNEDFLVFDMFSNSEIIFWVAEMLAAMIRSVFFCEYCMFTNLSEELNKKAKKKNLIFVFDSFRVVPKKKNYSLCSKISNLALFS